MNFSTRITIFSPPAPHNNRTITAQLPDNNHTICGRYRTPREAIDNKNSLVVLYAIFNLDAVLPQQF